MRLIDADALLAAYDAMHKGEPGRARKLIEEAPTVDAVPVLRCRECREYSGVNLSILGMPCGECERFGHVCGPDEFCAFGRERQEADRDAHANG